MSTKTWISTGEAADRLGYSRDHFREKFQGVIPFRRQPGGHFRWLAVAVEEAASYGDDLPTAS